jgi:hypothetical protein
MFILLPVADFTPNPNNYTTAALPRFKFTNNSRVLSTLGSKLVSHSWEFDDDPTITQNDTSSILSPEYYYLGDTGVKWVKLIEETNFGCKDTIIKTSRYWTRYPGIYS